MKQLKQTTLLIGELNQLFNRCSIQPHNRQVAMAVGLARHVAYCCPLPSSEVHNARLFFIESYQDEVNQFLSSINEHFVIDVKATLDLAFKLWNTRYKLVYAPTSFSIEAMMTMSNLNVLSEKESDVKLGQFSEQLASTLNIFTRSE